MKIKKILDLKVVQVMSEPISGFRMSFPRRRESNFERNLMIREPLTVECSCELDPCLRRDDNKEDKFEVGEKGFAPLLVVGSVALIIGLFVFLFFFFKQNNEQLENFVSSDIPPGVVTDAEGQICETQDAEFCHESPDIETWKDDGFN